jgi:hypothetical protein
MPNSISWTPEQLTALASVALFFATALLAVVTAFIAVAATKQLPLLARQLAALNQQLTISQAAATAADARHKETETLRVCFLFELNPVLNEKLSRLSIASKEGTEYSNKAAFRMDDILSVLNFLDGVATGVLEEFYHPDIVKDHLGPDIDKMVRFYIKGGVHIGEDGYEKLLQLHERFFPQPGVYRRN